MKRNEISAMFRKWAINKKWSRVVGAFYRNLHIFVHRSSYIYGSIIYVFS